jgi:hypothetical protein
VLSGQARSPNADGRVVAAARSNSATVPPGLIARAQMTSLAGWNAKPGRRHVGILNEMMEYPGRQSSAQHSRGRLPAGEDAL